MSADNYVGFYPLEDTTWAVVDGNASIEIEDCLYRGRIVSTHESEEEAMVAAFKYAETLPIVEYGVSKMSPIPETPCGACYLCVHERGIVDEEKVTRCDDCGKVITGSYSLTSQGTFCRVCKAY